MSTVLGDLAHHQERYKWSWGIISQLTNFGESLDPGDLPAMPNLPPRTVKLLLEPKGKIELERWMKAFRRSILLMRRFNAEREIGLTFNTADWRLMDESAAKAVEVLEKSLVDLAEASDS